MGVLSAVFLVADMFRKKVGTPGRHENGYFPQPAISINRKEKKRILVIDQEESFCTFVRSALTKSGRYEVAFTTKPLWGITMARTMRPDLILLAINMPGMHGPGVAERLLEDRRTRSIPIAFVTGLVTRKEAKDQRQIMVAGRTLIAKPINAYELVQVVGDILTVANHQEPDVPTEEALPRRSFGTRA